MKVPAHKINTKPSHLGHEEKFKSLFREYFPSLCIFACRYLADVESAKDAVHNVFIALWESPAQMDHLYNEKGYLYTLVRNHCLDLLRKQTVRNKYSAHLNLHTKENEEYFETEALREETYRQLDQAINKLPVRSREIIRLKMEGLKNQEIAEKLGLSINTINTLKSNSYKMLRSMLKDNFLICWLLFLHHSSAP